MITAATGQEQTGECLLQRNEVDLTTPDEERRRSGRRGCLETQFVP